MKKLSTSLQNKPLTEDERIMELERIAISYQGSLKVTLQTMDTWRIPKGREKQHAQGRKDLRDRLRWIKATLENKNVTKN